MSLPAAQIADNFRRILARIEAARQAALKPAPYTRLIAVTKTHDAESICPVLEAGHRLFGESRVQEAMAKWPALKREFPDIELHMTGPLQTNKVHEAAELFDAVHSLDRLKLALALKAEGEKSGRRPQFFVQVNTGEEPQKSGVAPQGAAALIAEARGLGLNVTGLMCVPPLEAAPAPHFALLAKLAAEAGLERLSMGMSDDFETAIRFGATHVRIGTAIFGQRD